MRLSHSRCAWIGAVWSTFSIGGVVTQITEQNIPDAPAQDATYDYVGRYSFSSHLKILAVCKIKY